MSAHDDYLDPDIHLWPETCPECENLEIEIEELQATVEKLTAAIKELSEDRRFLGNYSDETRATIAALKQAGE